MPVEILLIGAVAVSAAVVMVPAFRRLAWTFVDIVDASVAMFTIRRALGLDVTTARERRIERRRAKEQAEIERRIGVSSAGSTPMPTAPTRLIVSGSGVAEPAATVPGSGPLGSRPARQNLRDGVLAAVAVVIVGLVLASFMDLPTDGEVLGATSAPSEPAADATAAPDASAAPLASSRADPTPTPATMAPADPPGPIATDLSVAIIGETAGRDTIDVELAWAPAGGTEERTGLVLEASIDDGGFEPVDELRADALSVVQGLELGRSTTFRLSPAAAAGGGTAAGEPVTWDPLTAARTQESSARVRYGGGWRSAAGPSLLGGTVRFARDRGATARFTFTGTDVAWIGTRTPMSGRAEIRIDGERVATIDLAAPEVQYRRLLFRHQLEAGGRHDLEIRALGDGRVDLDAFVVLR